MDYKIKCECCDSIVTAYTHNLNKPIVSALRQIVDFYQNKRQMCNIAKDLRLTHNQIANFQKLQYFGLVQKIDGGWLPTRDGVDFVHGELSVLNPVATFKGQVIPYTHEAWKTHKGKPELTNIKDVDVFSYKQRPEYQSEKSQQPTLI